MTKTIAIFLAGQQGDIMSAASVLKYRNELWGDHKLVWYMEERNFDLLKYQDIELRIFPRGFGYPDMVIEENKKIEGTYLPVWEDWQPLVTGNNHLNLELKSNYPSLAAIDYGYFPAPHQMTVAQRHGIEYGNCSKKIFQVPKHYEWHPYLMFSHNERVAAAYFVGYMPPGRKILIETFAGSGQSRLDEEMIKRSMDMCREQWPDCVFIFASHKFLRANEVFPDWLRSVGDVYFANLFTVRECALIANQCDLMISVSSGITVASSAWGIKQPATLQFCGSDICGTKALANGHFELVTADDKPFEKAKVDYYLKLISLLNRYK